MQRDTTPCPPPDGCEDDSYWTLIDRQFAEQYDTDRSPEIPPPASDTIGTVLETHFGFVTAPRKGSQLVTSPRKRVTAPRKRSTLVTVSTVSIAALFPCQ